MGQAKRGSSAREGLFCKDEFRYDAERDAYVCAAGKLLTPISAGGLPCLRRAGARRGLVRQRVAFEDEPFRSRARRLSPRRGLRSSQ